MSAWIGSASSAVGELSGDAVVLVGLAPGSLLVVVAVAAGVLLEPAVPVGLPEAVVAAAVGVELSVSVLSEPPQALSSRRHTIPNVRKADLMGLRSPVRGFMFRGIVGFVAAMPGQA